MQLLRGLLAERGVPSFVADENMKVLNPLATGPLAFDARLQVPEEAVEDARAALEESRTCSEELVTEAEAPELRALAEIGRRIRWESLFVWAHPLLFVHGFTYVCGLVRTRRAPPDNGFTLLALGVVSALWLIGLGLVVSGLPL
jgi:hypothetical protein